MLSSYLIPRHHIQLMVVKYPIYSLSPTGPQIYNIVKANGGRKQKVSHLELQKLYARNRFDFQDALIQILKAGVHVIAEDYIGTGLAWGMTMEVDLKDLLEVNDYLLIPDVSILLDGKRFSQSIEKGHIFEDSSNAVWEKNRKIHKELAQKFGWEIVKSDDSPEKVHSNIWKVVTKYLPIL